MLRHARGVVVGALLALVVFAPAAEAACAWVMWIKDPVLNRHKGDAPDAYTYGGLGFPDVYESRAECEREAKRRSDQNAKTARPREPVISHVCLPDTIDLRAPKGGGR